MSSLWWTALSQRHDGSWVSFNGILHRLLRFSMRRWLIWVEIPFWWMTLPWDMKRRSRASMLGLWISSLLPGASVSKVVLIFWISSMSFFGSLVEHESSKPINFSKNSKRWLYLNLISVGINPLSWFAFIPMHRLLMFKSLSSNEMPGWFALCPIPSWGQSGSWI